MRRSASGARASPAPASLVSTSRSMKAGSSAPGGAWGSGWKAQWVFCFSIPAAPAGGASGQAAPAMIQASTALICDSVSRSPASGGGIRTSSSAWRRRRKSSDWSGRPSTRAGPESPPESSAASESSRRPAHCLSGPWHPWHCSTNSGRTCRSKCSKWCGAGGTGASSARLGRAPTIIPIRAATIAT